MKKDFIDFTPNQSVGGASDNVQFTSDQNPLLKSREVTVNFNANGVTKSVRSVQNGLPWIILSSVFDGYDKTKTSFPRVTTIDQNRVYEENGVLVINTPESTLTGANSGQPWFTFYSDSSNTFTLEMESGTYTFSKLGNVHYLRIETSGDYTVFNLGFVVSTKNNGAIIKFNGVTIIKIIIR